MSSQPSSCLTMNTVTPSAALPLKLIPPLPPSQRVSQEEHANIMQLLIVELSTLLRLPFFLFWSTVLYPQDTSCSVAVWLDAYFHFRPQEPLLAQKVFQLICRLGLAREEAESEESQDDASANVDKQRNREAAEWTRHHWPDAVHDAGLINLTRLLDIADYFADANLPVLQRVFKIVLNAQPRLIRDLKEAIGMLCDSVHGIQKKYGKVSKGKGKGKGKGADETSPTSPAYDQLHHECDIQSPQTPARAVIGTEEERRCHDADFLSDTMHQLRGAVLVGGDIVSDALLSIKTFVPLLTDAYQVANILVALDRDDTDAKTTVVSDPLAFLDTTFKEEYTVSERARRLKVAIIDLVEAIIHTKFSEPLNPTKRELVDHTTPELPKISLGDLRERTETLCDFIMQLVELSPFDGPVPFLQSAPLLVDLEVHSGLGDRLKHLRDRYMQNDSDARLDYVITSLEQILIFSGNAEIRRIVANRQLRMMRDAVSGDGSDKEAASSASVSTLDAEAVDEDYIKRSSLISQVQDLFPDLGDGFIEACLLAFDDDAETVIMKILENDLPDYVDKLDRRMQRTTPAPPERRVVVRSGDNVVVVDQSVLSDKEATPPARRRGELVLTDDNAPEEQQLLLSSRRNIYDGDEFDIFSRGQLDMNKVLLGKKEDQTNYLDDKKAVGEIREAVLQAEVSQYDEYDDEYDDTYDASEIKLAGTVELRHVDENEAAVDARRPSIPEPSDPFMQYEAELVAIYSSDPAVFDRAQRKSPKRAELRKRTGMSDEQLEGWFIMFQRNPRKAKILEQYAWRGNEPAAQQADSQSRRDLPNRPGTGSSPRHFQQGRGGGGQRGPSDSGGPDEAGQGRGGAQLSRQRARKDKNKARVGNHSRKDGHAKKMGRGMGGPM